MSCRRHLTIFFLGLRAQPHGRQRRLGLRVGPRRPPHPVCPQLPHDRMCLPESRWLCRGRASRGFSRSSTSLPAYSLGRHTVNMDSEVHNLLLLLLFQLSMYCTLESVTGEEGMISIWHQQQLWCMTLAMYGVKTLRGHRPPRLWAHDKGLRQPGFSIKICSVHLMRENSKVGCVGMCRHSNFCVHHLQSSCKVMTGT